MTEPDPRPSAVRPPHPAAAAPLSAAQVLPRATAAALRVAATYFSAAAELATAAADLLEPPPARPAPPPPPAPVPEPAPAAAPEPAPSPADDDATTYDVTAEWEHPLPSGLGPPVVPGWDELTLASIRARLRRLDLDELEQLHAYELAHAARPAVVAMLAGRVVRLRDGSPPQRAE